MSIYIYYIYIHRGFLKWWYPTTTAFPTRNDHDLSCEMGVPPFKETPNIFAVNSYISPCGQISEMMRGRTSFPLKAKRPFGIGSTASRKTTYLNIYIYIHIYIWVFPKMGVLPNRPLKNRVVHYFHHPFWGFCPYFWKHPYNVYLEKKTFHSYWLCDVFLEIS